MDRCAPLHSGPESSPLLTLKLLGNKEPRRPRSHSSHACKLYKEKMGARETNVSPDEVCCPTLFAAPNSFYRDKERLGGAVSPDLRAPVRFLIGTSRAIIIMVLLFSRRRRPRPGQDDYDAAMHRSQLQGCPHLRILSVRQTDMGAAGAKSLLTALRTGACADLRDLGLAGNIIGSESIKSCEELTKVRPLLRIIATRGDRMLSISLVLAFVLFWPFITTVAAICSRILKDAAQEQSIMSSLQSMPTAWAPEVFHTIDDIQRVNRLNSGGTAIEVIPRYLKAIEELPLKPRHMEEYLEGGGFFRLASICHQIRVSLLSGNDYDSPYSFQRHLAGLVVHLLGWWPDFFPMCLLDEVPIADHGIGVIANAMRQGHLPKLRSLTLQAQDIGPQGAVRLASAIQDGQHSDQLGHLDLSGNPSLGLGGVSTILHAMSRSPTLCPRLLHFDHTGTGILAADAVKRAVMGTGDTTKDCGEHGGDLESLSLSEPANFRVPALHVARAALRLIAWFRQGGCRSLRTLRLGGGHLGDNLVEQLLEAARVGGCHSFTTLDLSRCSIGPHGAATIASAMAEGGPLDHLETLILSNNRITTRGAKAILHEAMRRPRQLRVLDLSYNHIRQRDWLSCTFSTSPSLILSVKAKRPSREPSQPEENGSCAFTEDSAAPPASLLRVLRLRGNSLSPCMLRALSEAVASPNSPLSGLQELDLRGSRLTDKALESLLGPLEYSLSPNKAVQLYSFIVGASIFGNHDGSSPSPDTTRSPPQSSLRVLRLGSNSFTVGKLQAFLTTLSRSRALSGVEQLDLSFSSPTFDALFDLESSSSTTTIEYLRGAMRGAMARTITNSQTRMLVSAVACSCGSRLRFLDVRDLEGPPGRSHVYNAAKVLNRAEKDALSPSCSLTCLKRLEVAMSR